MYRVILLILLAGTTMNAQTRPHAYQVNKEQVRIYAGDDRAGTLVPTWQIQDDRYLQGAVICFTTFIRVALELIPGFATSGYNIVDSSCLDDTGTAMLLVMPDWKSWYDEAVKKQQ